MKNLHRYITSHVFCFKIPDEPEHVVLGFKGCSFLRLMWFIHHFMAAGEYQIKVLRQLEFIKFHVRHYWVFSDLLAVPWYTEWRQYNTDLHCMNSDSFGRSTRIQIYNDAKFMLRFKNSEHKIKKTVTFLKIIIIFISIHWFGFSTQEL